eukprot:UN34106
MTMRKAEPKRETVQQPTQSQLNNSRKQQLRQQTLSNFLAKQAPVQQRRMRASLMSNKSKPKQKLSMLKKKLPKSQTTSTNRRPIMVQNHNRIRTPSHAKHEQTAQLLAQLKEKKNLSKAWYTNE